MGILSSEEVGMGEAAVTLAGAAGRDYRRYLAAKKSIDDRALNPRVWESLACALRRSEAKGPIQVLELGGGIGSMVQRVLERALLANLRYKMIDLDPDSLAEARRRIGSWGLRARFSVEGSAVGGLRLESRACRGWVELERADAMAVLSWESGARSWDLLIAQAFLDLMDISTMVPRMLTLLKPGGLVYLCINFDGATILEPEIDPEMDRLVERLYHESMDRRTCQGRPSGDSKTGRHLLTLLMNHGAQIIDAGPSDWVVYPGPGGYTEDERYFLHYIIDTVYQALVGHAALAPGRLDSWVEKRHAQIEAGKLVYIAHQLDILARAPGPEAS